jgi:hypothetical protein
MRNAVLGTLFGAVLVALAAGLWDATTPAYAERSGLEPGLSRDLMTLTSPVDDLRQQLTVIDPKTRVVGVYHIHRDTGEITLKSVRNIHWDLQMAQFNSAQPLPREIRSLLEEN